ncbi:MAG: OmpA family protein [Candidatus Competibacteraceae bacterium]|nr:OmpA family protein [Candidatus Competibacteraceae bacterium]
MVTNLLDLFKAEFGDELIESLSTLLGEQPAATRTATQRVGEATLAGLIQRSAAPDGTTALANVLNEARFNDDGLAHLTASMRQAGASTGLIDQGKALLSSLFGERTDGLARWVSSSSGIGQSSALSLLSLIAPTVLSFIKRQFGGNVDASSLRGYLDSQRSFLEKSAPDGLLSLLGWQGGPAAGAAKVAPHEARPAGPAIIADAPQSERSGFPWYWLLLLLGLLVLGFLLMRGCDRVDTTATRTPAVSGTAPAAPAAPRQEVVASAAQPVELVLRDNVKLRVLPGSVEQRLVAFIEDPTKAVDDKTWFTFDGLEFETGSAKLKASSQERLKQIAAVLKAYPAVTIKVGGYTDNVGDPQTNLRISGERAKATLQELVNMGISANRMDAEGYGEQHPVADNATDQGRQKNRRVDIRVTAK